MRILCVVACVLACSGCMREAVRFAAQPDQEAITRDGQPALVSHQPDSVAIIRSAERRFASGSRPVFVLAIRNLTKAPVEFYARDITVTQARGDTSLPLRVFSYDELVEEEETKQVISTLLVGAAAGANAAMASQAGYSTRTTTVNTPQGSYVSRTTTYNPAASLRAWNRANRQNGRVLDAVIRQGDRNLDKLEREVIKDNTMMPGEWYGGTFYVQPPAEADGATGPKRYTITVTIGSDRHELQVVQASVK
jgi:hypothetical protein